MPVYALIVEYDGICFHGFQKQNNSFTVQDALERALKILLKPRENLRFSVAGRTDAGVHALGMVCSFVWKERIADLDGFRISLNALAGGKVSCLGIQEMPDRFHSRFSCTAREYYYKILYSRDPHPLWEGRAVWIREKVDWMLVKKQFSYLIGEKDFRALAKQNSVKDKPSFRNFQIAELEPDPSFPYVLQFRFKADSFLHNMIRILVGTLVDIGTGRIDKNLGNILQSGDRNQAGKTLGAHGLYFARAYYDEYPEIEELYRRINANPLEACEIAKL